jgi:hypothetical protein
MIGYPLVTVFSWTLPTIQHIGDFFSWENDLFSQISQVTVYIQGFLVFLIYCKTSPALRLWKRLVRQTLYPLPPQRWSRSQTTAAAASDLKHTSSYPSNMSLQPRLWTTETNSTTDFASRRMAFHSSASADYQFGDDDPEEGNEEDGEGEEEYEGHRFQNTSVTRLRWLASSFQIPPISEDRGEGEGGKETFQI